jgi:hypothetical protein
MQLKNLEHWCETVRARAEKTLPSSLNNKERESWIFGVCW